MATILIVEDDPLISMTAADMISDIGHQPIEAYSGTQALALLDARCLNRSVDDRPGDAAGMTGWISPARHGASIRPSPSSSPPGIPTCRKRTASACLVFHKPYVQEQLADAFGRLLAPSPDW